MCLDDQFRLCTCDGETLKEEDVGWILERVDPQLPAHSRRGKVMRPRSPADDVKRTIAMIIEELNTRDCFDCEMNPNPQVMYRLRLRHPLEVDGQTNNHWLGFVRSGGMWREDTSNGLTSWRTQLVRDKVGTVEECKVVLNVVPNSAGALDVVALSGSTLVTLEAPPVDAVARRQAIEDLVRERTDLKSFRLLMPEATMDAAAVSAPTAADTLGAP